MRFQNFINNQISNNIWLFHPQVIERLIIAQDIIDESFNWEKTQVEIIANTNSKVSLKFEYRDLSYIFTALSIGQDIWDIQYSLIGKPSFTANNLFRRLESGEINNKTLAAVVRCIKEFIKLKHPQKITFSSSDERLIFFYDTLIKQFENKLNMKLEKRLIKKDEEFTVVWIYEVL